MNTCIRGEQQRSCGFEAMVSRRSTITMRDAGQWEMNEFQIFPSAIFEFHYRLQLSIRSSTHSTVPHYPSRGLVLRAFSVQTPSHGIASFVIFGAFDRCVRHGICRRLRFVRRRRNGWGTGRWWRPWKRGRRNLWTWAQRWCGYVGRRRVAAEGWIRGNDSGGQGWQWYRRFLDFEGRRHLDFHEWWWDTRSDHAILRRADAR
jgi:hypothetical protein